MQSNNVVVGGVDDAIEQWSSFADMAVADVTIRCMADSDDDAHETIGLFGEVRRHFVGSSR